VCSHFRASWDDHPRCRGCQAAFNGQLCYQENPCPICSQWDEETWALAGKRTYRTPQALQGKHPGSDAGLSSASSPGGRLVPYPGTQPPSPARVSSPPPPPRQAVQPHGFQGYGQHFPGPFWPPMPYPWCPPQGGAWAPPFGRFPGYGAYPAYGPVQPLGASSHPCEAPPGNLQSTSARDVAQGESVVLPPDGTGETPVSSGPSPGPTSRAPVDPFVTGHPVPSDRSRRDVVVQPPHSPGHGECEVAPGPFDPEVRHGPPGRVGLGVPSESEAFGDLSLHKTIASSRLATGAGSGGPSEGREFASPAEAIGNAARAGSNGVFPTPAVPAESKRPTPGEDPHGPPPPAPVGLSQPLPRPSETVGPSSLGLGFHSVDPGPGGLSPLPGTSGTRSSRPSRTKARTPQRRRPASISARRTPPMGGEPDPCGPLGRSMSPLEPTQGLSSGPAGPSPGPSVSDSGPSGPGSGPSVTGSDPDVPGSGPDGPGSGPSGPEFSPPQTNQDTLRGSSGPHHQHTTGISTPSQGIATSSVVSHQTAQHLPRLEVTHPSLDPTILGALEEGLKVGAQVPLDTFTSLRFPSSPLSGSSSAHSGRSSRSPSGARPPGLEAQAEDRPEGRRTVLSQPGTDDSASLAKEARDPFPLPRGDVLSSLHESAMSRVSPHRRGEDAGHAQAALPRGGPQPTSLDLSAQYPAPLSRTSVKRRLSLSPCHPEAPPPKRQEQDLIMVLQDTLRSFQSSLEQKLDSKVEALRREFQAEAPPVALPPSVSQAPVPEPPLAPSPIPGPSSSQPPIYLDEEEVRLNSEVVAQRIAAWNDHTQAVAEVCPATMPGGPESSPVKAFHFLDPASGERASNPKRLPLHPSLVAGFEGLAISVQCPDTKSAHTRLSGAPLAPGKFLEPQRKFPDKFCRPSGVHSGFTKPAKVNHDLGRLSQSAISAVKPAAEKALTTQETLLRELVALHSVGKWQREAIFNIAAKLKEGSPPEPLLSALSMITPQLQSIDSRLEDRLCSALANTVLQRRDLHLAGLKGFKDPVAVAQLRSAPFLSEGLFGDALPDKLLAEAEEQRVQARLLQAAKTQVVVNTTTVTQSKTKAPAPTVKGQQAKQPFRLGSPPPTASRGGTPPAYTGKGGGQQTGHGAQSASDKNPKRVPGAGAKKKGSASRKKVA